MQASARPVTATGVVVASPAALRGVSIHDTSGAGNTIKIFDNASAASGTILDVAVLASGATYNWRDSDGVRANAGIYLSATGTVEGSVWVA